MKYTPQQTTIILVTVCTEGRQTWAACDEVHRILREVWQEATGWLVGYYEIMPDHLHYFTTYGMMDTSLEKWSQYWKSQFTKRYRFPDRRWQTDHWDTRIRSAEHYADRLEYIRNNAFRKNLVEKPDEWPYQGIIHDIRWES